MKRNCGSTSASACRSPAGGENKDGGSSNYGSGRTGSSASGAGSSTSGSSSSYGSGKRSEGGTFKVSSVKSIGGSCSAVSHRAAEYAEYVE